MKRSEIAISASLVPIDYLMVVLAGVVSYSLRYWQPIKAIRPVIFNLSLGSFLDILWLVALLWPISFALAGLYAMTGTRRVIDEMSRVILGCSTAVMALMFVFFFSRNLFDSRFIILAGWIFSIIFILSGRGLVRLFQHFLYYFQIGAHRVVIIGAGQLAREAGETLGRDIGSGYRVVGQFDSFDAVTEKTLAQMARQDKFDEILVAAAKMPTAALERLRDFSYLTHTGLKYIADIFDFPVSNFEINTIAGLPIVEVKKTRLDGWGRIAKRVFDLIFSFLLIVVLSPVMLLVALAVKLGSRGPLFFAYGRIGEQSRTFVYFKFRSMIKDAHKYRFDKKFVKQQENLRAGSPMMKFKNDPRITRVGRLIRRFSIDELPELFNVFIGKMSLVGPRPHEVEEVARYENFHRRVLSIKPGMTGMAQVSGRSDLDFDEEVRLDVWYMENWSLKLDIMILLKTPWAVLGRRRAD